MTKKTIATGWTVEQHGDDMVLLDTPTGPYFIQNRGSAECRVLYSLLGELQKTTEASVSPAPTVTHEPARELPLVRDAKLMLHVLRNPYGWSEDAIRVARLWAADGMEKSIKYAAAMAADAGWSNNLDP